MGGDGNPARSLSWRFPPVPTLTVTPARCRRALIISKNDKAQLGGWAFFDLFAKGEIITMAK